jgi:oligopeptidase B
VAGYDPAAYTTRRLRATSHDGTQVPLSIVHHRDLPMDGNRPVLLNGYGAYGYSFDPEFDSRWPSLLDRGFVLAIAHVRGGSELGRDWYEKGRLLHKANTFHDFIACAEALIAQGYTRPGRIAATGGSAGGLLMGVITNWRPELWGAVVARVPFTNVITAMLMPDLPLTIIEWEQWGNPAIPTEFEAMAAYSPYDNLRDQEYPPLLVKAGMNDLQVPYSDPAKYVARLRHTRTGSAPILLRMNMGAGHSGSSGRYAKIDEDAEMLAFVVHHLDADQRLR